MLRDTVAHTDARSCSFARPCVCVCRSVCPEVYVSLVRRTNGVLRARVCVRPPAAPRALSLRRALAPSVSALHHTHSSDTASQARHMPLTPPHPPSHPADTPTHTRSPEPTQDSTSTTPPCASYPPPRRQRRRRAPSGSHPAREDASRPRAPRCAARHSAASAGRACRRARGPHARPQRARRRRRRRPGGAVCRGRSGRVRRGRHSGGLAPRRRRRRPRACRGAPPARRARSRGRR